MFISSTLDDKVAPGLIAELVAAKKQHHFLDLQS